MPKGPRGEKRPADVIGNGSDKPWSMEDVADLVEAAAPKPAPRGPYRRRDQ